MASEIKYRIEQTKRREATTEQKYVKFVFYEL